MEERRASKVATGKARARARRVRKGAARREGAAPTKLQRAEVEAPAGPAGPASPAEPPASALPLFPGFVPDHEWVLGLVPIAKQSATRRTPSATAALLLEAGSAAVLHADRLSSLTPQRVGLVLRRALEHAHAHGLRRPTRLRLGSPAHASLLGEAARHGIEVVVGPAPEVDEALRTSSLVRGWSSFGADDVDVYRGAAAISDARLAAFFAAAGAFHHDRPWQELRGTPLRLRVPALGLVDGGMTLLHARGRGGLLVFRELEALVRAVEAGEASLEAGAWPRCLAVRFVSPSRLARPRRRELQALAFAPRRGPCPVLVPTAADGQPQLVEDHDYALATAALLATRRLLADFGPALRKPSLRALTARYTQVLELDATQRVEVELGLLERP